METAKNAVNYVSDKVNEATSGASKVHLPADTITSRVLTLP